MVGLKEHKTFPSGGRSRRTVRVMGIIPHEDPGHPSGQRLEHHVLTILDRHAVLSHELLQSIAEKHPEARWLYLTPPRAHYSFFGNGSGMENPYHAHEARKAEEQEAGEQPCHALANDGGEQQDSKKEGHPMVFEARFKGSCGEEHKVLVEVGHDFSLKAKDDTSRGMLRWEITGVTVEEVQED